MRPDLIIHTAAQPSHDRAAAIPFLDFEVNALGTLHLLEAARQILPGIAVHPHVHQQGLRRPAQHAFALQELETRWDYADPAYANGIPEDFSIDQSKHSLFGASKVAGDVMVQEYGRYFNMPTCCLRGGCLTGPNHSGVELHGFLSYLIKCNVRGPRIQGLRLQRQAGARQHPFRRRGALHVRVLEGAAGGGGVQSGRRQSQRLLDSGGFQQWRKASPDAP